MLKGFSVPLTPDGKSALANLPPWHYSSDCIAIEYWADPAAIAALLPPGLTPDEKSAGRAFFWFLDWQFTASNDEVTDPAALSISRGLCFGRGDLRWQAAVNYCPFIFVDNDAAMARGWAQGSRKNWGAFTRRGASPHQARPRRRLRREAVSARASRRMGKGWRPREFSSRNKSLILRLCSIARRRCVDTSRSSRRIGSKAAGGRADDVAHGQSRNCGCVGRVG